MSAIESRTTQISGACTLIISTLIGWGTHYLPFPPFTVGETHPVDALALAILAGLVIRQMISVTWTVNQSFLHWPRWAAKRLLPFAVGLLGAKLDLSRVMELSSQSLWMSICCALCALLLTERICMLVGVSQRLGRLIAIGCAICGGTAIAVTAPALNADDDEIAFSLTSVTLYGLLCVALYPLLGSLLSLTQTQFGVWTGVSVHATAQVIATAQIYGPQAGDVAIVVKLTRVLLLAPLLIGIRIFISTHDTKRGKTEGRQRSKITQLFPPFILGFLSLSTLNSLGLLSTDMHILDMTFTVGHFLSECSKVAMLLAMAGVGLMVDIRGLLNIGLRPLLAGLIATSLMSGLSLYLSGSL